MNTNTISIIRLGSSWMVSFSRSQQKLFASRASALRAALLHASTHHASEVIEVQVRSSREDTCTVRLTAFDGGATFH